MNFQREENERFEISKALSLKLLKAGKLDYVFESLKHFADFREFFKTLLMNTLKGSQLNSHVWTGVRF